VLVQAKVSNHLLQSPVLFLKIRYVRFKGRLLFHTKHSDYFNENVHMFDALDFLAEAHLTKPSAASSGRSLRELHAPFRPKGRN
jgi:hypothetical protein